MAITNPEPDIQARVRACAERDGDHVVLFNRMHLRLVSANRRGTTFKAALDRGLVLPISESPLLVWLEATP